jgi:Flp pilus assembly protein TadG
MVNLVLPQGRRRHTRIKHMGKKLFSRLWRAREGLGAVELGFIAPVLFTLLLGVLDFGMAFWQQMQIANAADAGAQWGMANAYNATSIRTVAQSATNLSTVTVDPTNPCGCATSTGVAGGYGTPPSCTACPDGTTAQAYIVVNAHMCYSTLFHWPGLTYCSTSDSNCSGCTSAQLALTAQSAVLK